METHLNKERFSQIAEESGFLTLEEVRHLEHCLDCVEAVGDRIRERIQQEDCERSA